MRKAAFWISALCSIALLAVLFSAYWLLGTSDGARFFLTRTAQSAGVRLEIVKLEGRLLGELHLEQTSCTTRLISLKIRSLRLHLQPGMLLVGTFAIKNLDLQGVVIQDNRPETEKPLDLTWPTLPGVAGRLNGWISKFTVRDFSYRRSTAKAVTITEMTGRLDLHGGQAALTRLTLRTPAGTVTGDAGISFRKPLLNLFATMTPKTPIGGFSRLLVRTELDPGRGPEQASGQIWTMASSPKNRTINLSATIGIARKSLRISDLALNEDGRKGMVTGSADISLAGPRPLLTARLKAEKLDLSTEVPTLPPVDGTVTMTGTVEKYRGTLRLSSGGTGMRAGSLSGSFSGTGKGASLLLDKGSWLDGTIRGRLAVQWSEQFLLSADLSGRNLDPTRITPEWKGVVNLNLNGEISKAGTAPLRGTISGKLLSSRLRGRQLTGELAARIDGQDFNVDRLLLSGKGFDIQASGSLARKIDFSLVADDLGGLIPDTAGRLRLNGELRRNDGRFGGNVSGTGSGLRMADLSIQRASFRASVTATREQSLELHLATQNLGYGSFQSKSTQLDLSGSLARHRIDLDLSSAAASVKTSMEGRYTEKIWAGRIVSLSGRDTFGPWRMERPTGLTLSSRGAILAPFALIAASGEAVELHGDWLRSTSGISLQAVWHKLNLARAGLWFPDLRLTGETSGSISLAVPPAGTAKINGDIRASGSFIANGYQTHLRTGTAHLETVAGEVRITTELDLAKQGKLTANILAEVPRTLTHPERGEFTARLDEFNLGILHAWLPEGLNLEGTVSARTTGKLLPGKKVQLTAQAEIVKGVLRKQQKGGELRAEIRSAALTVDWQGQTLAGTVAAELTDTGSLKGNFLLPLPAHLPLAMNSDGAVTANLTGTVRENGILTALFPGMIQESKGELTVKLLSGGTWRKPDLSGQLLLSKAGFYLPRAGVRISEVKMAAHFDGDRISIDSFTGRSGPGTVNVTGSVLLKNWRPDSYQGTIRGDKFQFIYLPELHVLGSPHLDVTGNMDKITVRGDLLIPELTVAGNQTPPPVRPSEDVVIVDAVQKKSRSFPLDLDIKVKVTLGDQVFVKTAGIDAQLNGAVDVTITNPNDIRGKGEIRVVKGSYKAYGVNLDINKGRIIFTGGPVSTPSLDILALRTVQEVSAGVIVVGTIKRPIIRLYSEPALSDGDIMGYMVLGHPLSGDQGQLGAVMQAAGLLLSASQSAVLNEQIINKFGIDSLGVEQDKSDITKSLVTVGKYLTPKLFISYGRSLFATTATTYLKARYTFTERWEVETWTGTESGLDVYYKINFN